MEQKDDSSSRRHDDAAFVRSSRSPDYGDAASLNLHFGLGPILENVPKSVKISTFIPLIKTLPSVKGKFRALLCSIEKDGLPDTAYLGTGPPARNKLSTILRHYLTARDDGNRDW
jgi:hypothetical protein